MWKTSHVSVMLGVVTIFTIAVTLYVRSAISAAIDKRVRQLQGNQGELGEIKKTDPFKMMSALSSNSKRTTIESIEPSIGYEEPTPEGRPPPSGSGSRWTPL